MGAQPEKMGNFQTEQPTAPGAENGDNQNSNQLVSFAATNSPSSDKTSTPRVVYRKEILAWDNEVIYAQDNEQTLQKETHTLPAFEVVETRYTDYNKDTKHASSKPLGQDSKSGAPPIVSTGPTRIVIKSVAAIHALRTVVGYYPGAKLGGDSVSIEEPFALVYHHLDALRQYQGQFAPTIDHEPDCLGFKDTYEDIQTLLDLVMSRIGAAVDEELARHKLDPPRCTHNMLWMILKPGTDVYYDPLKNSNFDAFVIKSVNWSVEDGSATAYSFKIWQMETNETFVGPSEFATSNTIAPFLGEKEIRDLYLFPCEYLNAPKHKVSHMDRRGQLELRGQKFFALLKGHQYVKFDGTTTTWPQQKFTGSAMVDVEQYTVPFPGEEAPEHPEMEQDIESSIKLKPRCTCLRCKQLAQDWSRDTARFAGYSKINPLTQERLTPHQEFLCTRTMRAFLIKHRKWEHLDVDGFTWPKFKPGLIDTLTLTDITRSLLRKLSTMYVDQKESKLMWSADVIEGKGSGSIILLHGKPGVGKTYTAECVAEEAKRPLLSLSCADIGTEPDTVEKKLEFWFRLAKRWKAILLLDEADVYMERRSISDLKRNNLVAGFLRTLEFYQGILFLTTNRIGTFDEAFLSRIDIPIFFKDFTEEQRVGVWGAFFKKLEKEREKDMRVSQAARRYVKEDPVLLALEWNGREIRNAFQTAVALAEVEDNKDDDGVIAIEPDHIQQAVVMAKEFRAYLEKLYQKNNDDMATALRLRYDKFGKKAEESGSSGSAGPF